MDRSTLVNATARIPFFLELKTKRLASNIFGSNFEVAGRLNLRRKKPLSCRESPLAFHCGFNIYTERRSSHCWQASVFFRSSQTGYQSIREGIHEWAG